MQIRINAKTCWAPYDVNDTTSMIPLHVRCKDLRLLGPPHDSFIYRKVHRCTLVFLESYLEGFVQQNVEP